MKDGFIGPFVGFTSSSTAKLWLYKCDLEKDETISFVVTLHEGTPNSLTAKTANLYLNANSHNCGTVVFSDLKPDTTYYYKIWSSINCAVEFDGLDFRDLFFRTFPQDQNNERIDFIVMSCNDPTTMTNDGHDGYGVWSKINEIRKHNDVRFALLAGDQVYADKVEPSVLNEESAEERKRFYLEIYKQYWSNFHYRKVLCSLPALMMWDDHDITDGWGSREESYINETSDSFKPEWLRLFETAKQAFQHMQASRNPEPLSKDYKTGFDTCFKIGRSGFALVDLRSNRNVRKKQIWLEEQFEAMKSWVEANRNDIDTFFFTTPVVFSHGSPRIEKFVYGLWPAVLKLMALLVPYKKFKQFVEHFNKSVGDIRDDISDSWTSEANQAQAEQVLDYFYELQNPTGEQKPIQVVILSGDIHTAGYSTIYSSNPKHAARAIIPHIVTSPVAYKPFSWVAEAVFRNDTKNVPLGASGQYSAQISHHFCHRNIAVISTRNLSADERQLKVKYYLEHFPEPQIMLFDLNRSSHRENIKWTESKATSVPNTSKTPNIEKNPMQPEITATLP